MCQRFQDKRAELYLAGQAGQLVSRASLFTKKFPRDARRAQGDKRLCDKLGE